MSFSSIASAKEPFSYVLVSDGDARDRGSGRHVERYDDFADHELRATPAAVVDTHIHATT